MFAALNSFLTRAVSGYFLNKSLRFRSSASAYLSRTPATATNRTTWTWSAWVKRGLMDQRPLFFAGTAGTDYTVVQFRSTDELMITQNNAASATAYIISSALFRDPAAWYHIVAVWNTTSATATMTGTTADRLQLWVNGVQISSFSLSLIPSQNASSFINSNVVHYEGRYDTVYFDGEMAEVNFVDGQALTPTSFGASSIYNQWLPIRYAGTYGTNGFYLPFTNTASTSTLVADSSGNANNWTPNNISLTAGSTYDSLTDVPTLTSTTVANYCVLNPLSTGRPISAGNLQYGGSATGIVKGTIAVTTGKWYFEFQWTGTAGPGAQIGIALMSTSPTTTYLGSTGATGTTGYGYYSSNGNKYSGSGGVAYGASYTTSDVIGVALDLTAGTLTYYKNNVSQGVAFTGLVGEFTPAAGSDGTNDTGGFNFGQQPFAYTPPSGFLPLNTFNIAAGTVTTSGTFTGNASTDGPMVWLNGTPTAMTINGNAVTFGTHADKLANGFKVRSSSASYNTAGSNTYVATTVAEVLKYENAQPNP